MKTSQAAKVEEIAMYLGSGLVLFGTVAIGIIEMIGGHPQPVSEEGEIVAEALFPLPVRSYVILLGFVIWGLCAVYATVLAPRTRRRHPRAHRG